MNDDQEGSTKTQTREPLLQERLNKNGKTGVSWERMSPRLLLGYALRLGWYANSVSLLEIPSVWASCSTVVFMSCS